MSNNLATLTRSHNIVASKKRLKRTQIKEIVFDDDARRDFLTGFHKRKLQHKEEGIRKAREREKKERLEARREKRKLLAEEAVRNAEEVERAYGGIGEDNGGEDDVTVFSGVDKGKQRATELEDEYEDEEQLATVTVVEDFDPHELTHGPQQEQRIVDEDHDTLHRSTANRPHDQRPDSKQITSSKKIHSKVVKKAKDIKYQTQAARKAERAKQRRRSTEKAERAGGKAARKKVPRRGPR